MHLTPREIDKLMIFTAGEVARKRRSRGLKLNYPEAVALITSELLEEIRNQNVDEVTVRGSEISGTLKPSGRFPEKTEFLSQARVTDGLVEKLVRLDHEVDEPHLQRLAASDDASREKQIERTARAHHPWQQPS